MATPKQISLPSPFSHGNAVKWFQRFEICCNVNEWNDGMRSYQHYWKGKLSEEQRVSYSDAKAKMIERLRLLQFFSVDKFHHRRLLNESLPIFVHDLKRFNQPSHARSRGHYTAEVANPLVSNRTSG